jgi:cell division protease FtsH
MPYVVPQVGPSAEWQARNASPNSYQLETFTGSAIATGALTVAAACVSSSRGARSIPCALPSSSELRAEAGTKEPESDNFLSQLANFAAEVVSQPHQVGAAAVQKVKALALAELQSGKSRHQLATEAFVKIVDGADAAFRESAGGQLRWVASSVASMLLTFVVTLQPANADDQVTYSDFLEQVQSGNVEMVRVQSDMMSAQYQSKDGSRHEVNLVPNATVEDALFDKLAQKKVDVVMQSPNANTGGPLDFLARFAGPIAWLIAGLLLLFGGAGAGGPAGMGGQNPFQLGKSPAKIVKDGDTKVKFPDVAGCDGAKEELVEVVDFLKNTSRYTDLGAKIPKGALLVGPPGTGKTLLAKAVAGEAGVPFFSISASEFVEVYAGIGAARVRDLFSEAKKSAPCIIFIDEIDAVGRQRSAGFGQGNDEREQTVNQLLTEMDGFDGNKGVVVLAATNRADILDNALVRPGRFDRRIQVDPPDVEGRTAILKVHAKDKSLAPGVDLQAIARQTPGMSGADLANLLNEGAIVAARKNQSTIEQDDIATALERIFIGLEKKDAVMSEKKKKLVAYHESGHAILGALMNDYDVVAKISIVPRGPAGGVTIFMPSEDRLNSGLYSKEFLENRMCVALGGRLAEEILNGKDNVTTGASNDFQQCTQVAEAMVKQLGMSDVVGQRVIGGQEGGGGGPFMGRDFMGGGAPPVSQSLRQKIDAEVRRIVDEQYERGMKLLSSNMPLLHSLAAKLMDQEKVSGEELMKLVNETAAQGKLTLAAAAYTGEIPPSESDSGDDMLAAAALVSKRRRIPKTTSETTGSKVFAQVSEMAKQATKAELSASTVRTVTAQVLAAMAATSIPFQAYADTAELPSAGTPVTQQQPALQQQQQQQQQQPQGALRVSGRVTYSRLLEFVDEGSVKRVDLYDAGRTAVTLVKVGENEQQLVCDLPGTTTGLLQKLQAKDVQIEVHTPEKPNPLFNVLGDVAFPLIVIAGLLFLRSQSGTGAGGIPGFGDQNKAKIQIQPETGVKFEDVAGIDEAKEELTEIVDFLKAPERFVKVGAKIPRGVLLTGPPGTGKTLMAKALAGESGVPFIQSSASEFIELFVGVGASRVRDIFKQAKEKAPCIVFIDEIDAIGRQRGAGMGGGNDEREQTLNQILTEMDGFEGNSGVIVVAATNRSDILDNALLRPGRFDRRVEVGLPDVQGREQILGVHVKNKKLADDVNLKDVAQRTSGFSGADLENLMNESAILTARRNKKATTNEEIQDATDRVIAGLQGRALADNASKKLIAYHEAGHALVGTLLPHHDPVSKVTLVPRGQAKGLTWFTPSEDQSLVSLNTMKARISGALGGRAAEQVVFGSSQVTSGAGGDLQQVERLARAMVTQVGMSNLVGPISISEGGYAGPNYSEDLSTKIDDAIRSISDECYINSLTILAQHRPCLDRIVEELMETETLPGDRLREIVAEYTAIPEKLAAV